MNAGVVYKFALECMGGCFVMEIFFGVVENRANIIDVDVEICLVFGDNDNGFKCTSYRDIKNKNVTTTLW